MKNVKLPNKQGYFGKYGGQFVPDIIKKDLDNISAAYKEAKLDPAFTKEYRWLLRDYVGRPSPLYYAKRLSKYLGGAKIYLKREDLNHTGAHKINHTIGEALLAKRIGKTTLLAETGAGQHGVALATAAALVGLKCQIHMGEIDIKKQKYNVEKIKMLGAKLVTVKAGGRCLKDAVDSAFQAYLKNPAEIFFGIGSVVGPHPYPMMVRDFQSVIGLEIKRQIRQSGRALPDYLIACVGGGSNAIGLFTPFLHDKSVQMIGVEPGGIGKNEGQHAATLMSGTPGNIHGMFTYLLQTKSGLPASVHSIASGLDYPGIGPEHAHLKDSKRVQYVTVNDRDAVFAFHLLTRLEGIIPALESAHALAYAIKLAPTLPSKNTVIVNLSGRGDKDIETVSRLNQTK